ncbi:hypothetical protein H8356DRAFT_1288696 [Neocallimastix lanati (nom. inval.)]|uniref:Uncharacterized protein n=1 Tax=Neocallimastix californiae TaxID=1754190 RepID=A0A1Y2AKZ7_9FUNG|nr:hypothetical protein H8356DRAFT_1391806 [Neocallimastix sp. JGI-2020a]KAG4102999.1 hypothetical protein H8356DRAFT_1288696 [Neocallimastix sp. JGI-2020a]ORY23248.1 hypothetical protein LY90DRAFT_515134 [Neocallimastix californiae]|eukprot:ORY23248.1 hypothetical protein LY90DRAFT_515134 [Neocallimastix californiae]
MFKLLVKYSIEKGIKLIIDENDIEKMISEKYYLCKLRNISEINSKFIELIYFYKNKNIIKVIFSRNSYFLKKFNEINENERIENEIESMIKESEKERRAKEKIKKENELKKKEWEDERKKKEK